MTSIVIAITGASGASLGVKFAKTLPSHIHKYIILTKNANVVLEKEENITMLDNDNIAASISSGSFKVDAMVIIPTSMNTLAKIACGISDNLVTRAASVFTKERRTLLLAPREMPFSAIALENMLKLSRLNIIIAPPVLATYSNPKNIDELEDFMIGKWFDLLGIEHSLFKRWEE